MRPFRLHDVGVRRAAWATVVEDVSVTQVFIPCRVTRVSAGLKVHRLGWYRDVCIGDVQPGEFQGVRLVSLFIFAIFICAVAVPIFNVVAVAIFIVVCAIFIVGVAILSAAVAVLCVTSVLFL